MAQTAAAAPGAMVTSLNSLGLLEKQRCFQQSSGFLSLKELKPQVFLLKSILILIYSS